jgi:glyoxylase-like metal-dependent hydrolase (beta-lactamase superfamily II)
MFEIKSYKEISRIMMGSEINGHVYYKVAAYLVDDLLIDTGCHNTRWELVDYLANKDVSLAVNTHHHIDHIGGNKAIRDRLKLPVFAPRDSVPIIAGKQDIFPYQKGLWGCPEPCLVIALGDTINTANYTLDVVQTSGHSPDHAVFFLREKGWLFTGDEFVNDKPNSARKNEDNRLILKALKRMLTLEPSILITSSGKMYGNASNVLEGTISYLEETKDRILSMKNKGLSTREIVVKLFEGETWLKEFTADQFCRENFVQSFFKGEQ